MVYPEPFLVHSNSQYPAVSPITDAKALLAAAIEKLSPTGRLVLCLHYYEGLEPAEIAEVLDVKVTEVHRIHAAVLAHLYASGCIPVNPPAHSRTAFMLSRDLADELVGGVESVPELRGKEAAGTPEYEDRRTERSDPARDLLPVQ